MAKVRCPECKAAVEVDPKPGAVVECEECGKKFRLAAKQPAAAAVGAAGRRTSAPVGDDDELPVEKPKKKKKRRKSAGLPGWVLPAFGGVTVLVGVILLIVFVAVPALKRGKLLDPLNAITEDVDSVAVVRPKGVTGASGIGYQVELGKGGGGHYAPTPPEGYDVERGQVTESIRVRRGLKAFYVISADWKPRPTTPATIWHRDVPIREDQPKHLDKPRYVVAGASSLALFETVEDAKAAIDLMLDNKKPGFAPRPKAAAYFTQKPGHMEDIFVGHAKEMLSLRQGPDIDKPKSVFVEMNYTDEDQSVVYSLDYGTPEAATAAKKSIEAYYKRVDEAIKEWWGTHRDVEGNPFENVDRLKYLPKEIDGGKLKLRVPYGNVARGASMPLIRECFNMGDAPFGGFDEEDPVKGVGT